MTVAGILGNIFNFSLMRLAINVYLIFFGLVLIAADIRAFPVLGYAKLIYHPIGRGLFLLFIGLLLMSNSVMDIAIGAVIIAVGLLYAILTFCNGGIPKPVMQRNTDEMPLNTELRFVDVQNT